MAYDKAEYTSPRVRVDVDPVPPDPGAGIPPARRRRVGFDVLASAGRVRVRETVTGYVVKDNHTQAVVDEGRYGGEGLPAADFVTDAVWFDVPVEAFRRVPPDRLKEAAAGALNLCVALMPAVAMCDARGVAGAAILAGAGDFLGGELGVTLYLYDTCPNGVGLAARAYDEIEGLWERALRTVAECPCAEGCPSCVQAGFRGGRRVRGNATRESRSRASSGRGSRTREARARLTIEDPSTTPRRRRRTRTRRLEGAARRREGIARRAARRRAGDADATRSSFPSEFECATDADDTTDAHALGHQSRRRRREGGRGSGERLGGARGSRREDVGGVGSSASADDERRRRDGKVGWLVALRAARSFLAERRGRGGRHRAVPLAVSSRRRRAVRGSGTRDSHSPYRRRLVVPRARKKPKFERPECRMSGGHTSRARAGIHTSVEFSEGIKSEIRRRCTCE